MTVDEVALVAGLEGAGTAEVISDGSIASEKEPSGAAG